MADETLGDIFDVSADDIKDNKSGGQQNFDLYKPNPKNAPDQTYTSTIRFLPDYKNPKRPFVKKFTYWLEDKEGNGAYYDSPYTIGKNCPIAQTFFTLSKSEDYYDQKAAEKLKRKTYFYSLVQIVKDKHQPELEGKVMAYRFPIAIKKLIDEQLEPDKEEQEQGVQPCNVYDPFKGKDFFIKMTIKAGFWNYDGCKFIGEPRPMRVPDENGELVDAENKDSVLKYLEENYIDLSKFDYKPWTSDQEKKVKEILRDIAGDNAPNEVGTAVEDAKSTSDEDVSSDEMEETPGVASQPDPTSPGESESETETETETKSEASDESSESSEEESKKGYGQDNESLDDFLEDL